MREKVAGGRDKSVLEWKKKMSLGVENRERGRGENKEFEQQRNYKGDGNEYSKVVELKMNVESIWNESGYIIAQLHSNPVVIIVSLFLPKSLTTLPPPIMWYSSHDGNERANGIKRQEGEEGKWKFRRHHATDTEWTGELIPVLVIAVGMK